MDRPAGRPAGEKKRSVILIRKARKMKTRIIDVKTPTPTPKKRAILAPRKVLALLGVHCATTENICRHLPPRNLRWTPAFRTGDDDDARKGQNVVFRYLWRVVERLFESLCGPESSLFAEGCFKKSYEGSREQNSVNNNIAAGLRAMVNTAKGSSERRIIRATICGMFLLKDLSPVFESIPGSTIGHTTYAKSRQQSELLEEDGKLECVSWTRRKFTPRVVDGAINTILSSDSVSFLSWGTKQIVLHGISHDVPSILLKKPTSVIYDEYLNRTFPNYVSRATFYRLSSVLTEGHIQPRTAIDYVTGMLINDSVKTLYEVIDACAAEEAEALKVELDYIQAWLKYSYGKQTEGDEAGCPRHDLKFGLSSLEPELKREVSCKQCISLHRFFVNSAI